MDTFPSIYYSQLIVPPRTMDSSRYTKHALALDRGLISYEIEKERALLEKG